ncbi:MAG: ATP:cob(I)alamin adenosyltransferase, partial [Nitrosopumilaceae archaeon]|nr:ATP:cob(I)alamin adenosyltransferase [Nitrosopumilaceae archaeon]NIU02201.1 ATP:cob(I)alamin adenosyltransferase [Nitrosopumilaceae archaeon]NIU88673.1 ATP:cob(I)alamin adenosyltransferase [Nitrosopumilaceae archaeon]NIV66823.1 ATP:cob(I)alamin adenosyltransferase [Nitrosopumilaceae archaeon]NIX62802.1 ATP:cob(I)alamin adenosyltransferase [Nitrosopumilaceae archaeon]
VVALAEKSDINKKDIQYLNRLSDLLFVIARKVNKDTGVFDIPWKNNTKQM